MKNKSILEKSEELSTLERAILITALVHECRKDKSGAANILHTLRLVMRIRSEAAMIAALLHGVVEERNRMTNGHSKGYEKLVFRMKPSTRLVLSQAFQGRLRFIHIAGIWQRNLSW